MNYEFTAKATGLGLFSYDAATATSKRRRNPGRRVKSEDNALGTKDRDKLTSSIVDVRRNFAIARWAINKHLDFVVSHNFRSKSGVPDLDRRIERFVERASRKEFFDVTGRHPRRRFMRILEAMRVLGGDVFGVKLSRGFLQPIEGDRCRDPDASNKGEASNWISGLDIDKRSGRVRNYAFHSRTARGSFEFERKVRAERVIPFGYFDRFDQYRGVSPLASAVNSLQDLYESFDYALAKAKVSQLFALAIFRDADGGFWEGDADEDSGDPYEIDFASNSPKFLDLDPGDRAEFLESRNPSSETAAFWQAVISIALKSLDLPYSFYDEAYTNFFGSRSALLLYLKSARDKQADVREFLDAWLCWRLEMAIADGEIDVPADYVCDPMSWTWIPEGIPWWNPKDEVAADLKAVDGLLRSRQEIRQERFGDDWFDLVDRIAEEKDYAAGKGLTAAEIEEAQQVEVINNGEE